MEKNKKFFSTNFFDDGSLPLITPVKREDEKEEIFFSPVKNSLLVMGVGFRFYFAFYSLKKIRPGTEPGETENLIRLIFKLDIERNASHTFADGFIYFRSQFRPQFLLDFLLD